ncbi:hypothetical protein D3C86_1222050 [compost metagenome]
MTIRIEGKDSVIRTSCPDAFAAIGGAQRLSGVLDHRNIIDPGDSMDAIEVCRVACPVIDDDSLGSGSDAAFEVGWIEVAGQRVDVAPTDGREEV